MPSYYVPEYVRDSSPCLFRQTLSDYSQVFTTQYMCPIHAPALSMVTATSSIGVRNISCHLHTLAKEILQSYAPYMHTVSLPPPGSIVVQKSIPNSNILYPIGIISSLPLNTEIELETMILTCPIHIHTPQGHIGTIHSHPPGETMSALYLFCSLRTMADGHWILSRFILACLNR